MNSLNAFIAKLAGIDVKIWSEDGKLRVSGPDRFMTPELRAELSEHKAELLAFLSEAASAPDAPPGVAAGIAPPAGPAPVIIDHDIGQPFAWKRPTCPGRPGL